MPLPPSVLAHYVRRLHATRNHQLHGHSHVAEDPVTGRRVAVTPSRAHRPGRTLLHRGVRSVSRESCLCSNPAATPAVLAYVDSRGELRVPYASEGIDEAERFLAGRDRDDPAVFRDLTEHIRPHNEIERGFRAKLVRNLYHTPRLGNIEVISSLVVAVGPEYHECEFSELPVEVIAAILELWKLAESAAREQNLIALPFVNAGPGGRAGNTFLCPHAQFYVLDRPPVRHNQILQRLARSENCRLCKLAALDDSPLHLPFDGEGGVRLCAHPAPEQTWSLMVLPAKHGGSLNAIPVQALAGAISAGLGAWKRHFGMEPDFNIVARVGAVGHAHIELTPRNTNTPGGAELASGEVVIDVAPDQVRARLFPGGGY